jgi:hypothetical protein
MEQETPQPVCVPVPGVMQESEVILLNMTLAESLNLKLEVGGRPIQLIFDDVRGLRVLDEGDLLEFWDKYHTGNGWLWEVQSGGWFDLERRRSTFVMAASGVREFLVVTGDFCVSVFSRLPPELIM